MSADNTDAGVTGSPCISPLMEIYCKIGCDQFPTPPWCNDDGIPIRAATGKEVVDFLEADTMYAFDEKAKDNVAGDKAIWYLSTCLKRGYFRIDDWELCWGMGEACSENVIKFITELFSRNIIDQQQRDLLLGEVAFADQTFGNCYDIWDWLIAKKDGTVYQKPVET